MMKTVLVLIAGLLTTGCAFGTNYVRLPATQSVAMPASGDQLAVQVKDGRAELSGAAVGFKRNGYGAKTGSVALAGNEILADRISRDVVALLRERGYRALDLRDASVDRTDLLISAEVASFIVDVQFGFWTGELQGSSVVKLRAVQPASRQSVWEEIVRAEYKKTGLMAVVEDDHQEVVEGLYRQLLGQLKEHIPRQLPR